MADPPRIALVSLEPWDDVWRRNQHLAARLVASGSVASVLFVEPPRGGLALRARHRRPVAGIEVVTPPLVVPRRFGGHPVLGMWLRRQLAGVDLVWVNDPVAGRAATGRPAVYDVTDDWRSMPQDDASRRRIVAAEDELSVAAVTVVCSAVLATRWRERYGVEPDLVPNGVDLDALRAARPVSLDGPGRHAVYVGTLHANRLDLDLALELAADPGLTLHLVGPDHLDDDARTRLRAAGARLRGPVPHAEVPGWLVAADVLVCPHRVDDFTLSLDAIKAHEYLATDRPIVATPSSGFQDRADAGLRVVARAGFVAAVHAAADAGPVVRATPPSWDDRAREAAGVLHRALSADRRS